MINQIGRNLAPLFGVALTLALAQSNMVAQGPASHRMEDNFLYEVVDVGLGEVPTGLRRVYTGSRSSLTFRSSGVSFWLALRVTNLATTPARRRLPRLPLFIGRESAVDDAKNNYSVRRVQVQTPQYDSGIEYDWRGDINDRGDYASGAFSIQLLFIPEKELLRNIKELQVTIYDATTSGGLRTRRFFSIKNPLSLKRDFKKRDFDDGKNPATAAEVLPVEARTEVTSLQK